MPKERGIYTSKTANIKESTCLNSTFGGLSELSELASVHDPLYIGTCTCISPAGGTGWEHDLPVAYTSIKERKPFTIVDVWRGCAGQVGTRCPACTYVQSSSTPCKWRFWDGIGWFLPHVFLLSALFFSSPQSCQSRTHEKPPLWPWLRFIIILGRVPFHLKVLALLHFSTHSTNFSHPYWDLFFPFTHSCFSVYPPKDLSPATN